MKKSNIILTGMPGAGKSTIGIALSYMIKKPFVDIDNYIERTENMSVSKIFDVYGSDYFREIEAKTAKHFGLDYKNTIISTGGGIVLNPQNMEYLKSDGLVVYINRSVENILKTLNAEKRPLLKENPEKLYEMYNDRHKLYLKYADIVVLNSSDFRSGVKNVYDAIKDIAK